MPRIDEHPLSQAPSQQINISFNFITAQETLPCPLLAGVWHLHVTSPRYMGHQEQLVVEAFL